MMVCPDLMVTVSNLIPSTTLQTTFPRIITPFLQHNLFFPLIKSEHYGEPLGPMPRVFNMTRVQ